MKTYEGDYGQYLQELTDPASALHAFKPDAVLFAFDAHHLLRGASAGLEAEQADALPKATLAQLRECWRHAREAFRCQVIQQTVLPVFPALLGSNEHRLPGSPQRLLARLNAALRDEADDAGVDLLALDDRVARDGLTAWHDPALWHRAKQEISPAAAPMYGELVARLLAAQQGRSRKCLVLDLDNTLWGGVIGDDGLDGIVLGQGSALGEAFLAFQHYARELARRGVILAVCSKNDEANALEPFEQHPEMVLKRDDIACFVANWDGQGGQHPRDRRGAEHRPRCAGVRRRQPVRARPGAPRAADGRGARGAGGPGAVTPACLADAGYFEALAVTAEDLRARRAIPGQPGARGAGMASATDLRRLSAQPRDGADRGSRFDRDRPAAHRAARSTRPTSST